MSAREFLLAPMSGAIRALTTLLLLLPAGLAVAAVAAQVREVALAAAALAALYFLVWFAARPTRFEVDREGVRVVFPAWTRTIRASERLRARPIDARDFRQEFGLPLRIGVGGLWGGFGWLWTSRRGLVEFYVSRTDGLVLVERDHGRPLLITPEKPQRMIEETRELFPDGAAPSRRVAT